MIVSAEIWKGQQTILIWIVFGICCAFASEGTSHTTDEGHGNSSESNHSTYHPHGVHVASLQFDYVKQPFILTVFMAVVVLVKMGFHRIHILANHIPESCVLIILGTTVGAILHVTKVDVNDFYYIHPDKFFLFLLPPCILEASYELHDVVFFQNLGTILIYAVIGTLLNCFIIGPILYGLALAGMMGSLSITLIECLVFSSLIVAVDPVAVLAIFQEIGVNSVLYFLVFGESLLNDAVTVVLYNTMKALSEMDEIPISQIFLAIAAFFTVSLGGLSIGLIFGIITSFVTRYTCHVRVVEPLEVLAMAYCSYLTAELFHFSGIISMIGCGLIQVHYAFHNISQNSATTIKYFIKMLSTTCDCIIFMFLGIALVRDDHEWNTGFVLGSAVLCLVVRFLVTIVITFCANLMYRERKIDRREQFIMGYGGLRGAVAFCLVAMLPEPGEGGAPGIPHKNLFQTTVFFVIIFTVFVQGISIKPLVNVLHIGLSEEKVVSLYQEINDHMTSHALAGIEDIIGHYGHNKLKEFLLGIDDKLKEALQRDPLTSDEVIMELYKEIAIQQHYEMIYGRCEEISDSQPQLYQAKRKELPDDDKVFEDERNPKIVYSRTVSIPFEPELYRGIDTYRADLVRNRKSLPPSFEHQPPGYTPSDVPHADKRSVRRFLSEDHSQNSKQPVEPAGARRRRYTGVIAEKLRRSVSGPEYGAHGEMLTRKVLHKLLAKTAATNAFRRRADRNLRGDENTDLMYHLQEKQRRHERFLHSVSVFTPTSPLPGATPRDTPHTSMDNLHVRDKSFMADGDKHSDEGGALNKDRKDEKRSSTPQLNRKGSVDDYPARSRHATEGSKGTVIKYVPRFRPHRPMYRLADQPKRYTMAEIAAIVQQRQNNRSSLPPIETAVVDETAHDQQQNGAELKPDECVVLLADSSKDPSRSFSHKGRGQLRRQDAELDKKDKGESKV